MEETTKEITALLRDLAAQIGVTVQELYRVLTERALYEGVVYTSISAVLAAVLLSLGLRLLYAAVYKPDLDDNGKYTDSTGAKFAIGTIFLVACVIAFYATGEHLIQALTPEASAVHELLRTIR